MATNDFKQLMQHHLNQTRAGLYGQFEHAFNFNEGADQDALMKIGPGQSITFSGELLDGQPCTLIATNNLTSTSGAGFAAQSEVPDGREIVIPVTPRKGTANLEFSCPTGGGTSLTVSYVVQGSTPYRWQAHDENDQVIFSRNSTAGNTFDIVTREDAFFICGQTLNGGPGFGRFAHIVEHDRATGSFQWRGTNVDYRTAGAGLLVAYDPLHDVVGMFTRSAIGAGITTLVCGFVRGFDQGVSGEPDPLYETSVDGEVGKHRTFDFKADGNGHFLAIVVRNDDWVTPNSGTFANVFKIDALTGAIVATYNTGNLAGDTGKLAIDPNSGNIAICTSQDFYEPDGGSGPSNVVVVDSDLNFISQDRLRWADVIPGGSTRARANTPTWDEQGRLYVVSTQGLMVRYSDSSLATRDVVKSLFTPTLPDRSSGCTDVGHDLAGKLHVMTGGADFNNIQAIQRFDNDGNFISEFIVDGAVFGGNMEVARYGSGPGPDLGNLFTQEFSQTPPGKRNAVGAVKYQAGNITGIFFNSVDVQFDPSKWTAVHSVNGPVPILASSPGWEYNSPL